MPPTANRLIVFAKAPDPGRTKTRLIPALGPEGAAALHRMLVHHTLAQASAVTAAVLELHGTRIDDAFLRACAARYGAALIEQSQGDLGARMHAACADALRDSRFVVLIGSDCPALTSAIISEAFRALEQGHDAVHCPTEDGGYALVGLARCDARLFSGIAWSTPRVMEDTRGRLRALAWRACELDMLWDVDRPEDYQRLVASGLHPPVSCEIHLLQGALPVTPPELPDLAHPHLDAESIRKSLYHRLVYSVGKDPITATERDWFYSAAAVLREGMIERWMETMRSYYTEERKRVYYLSLEFLMGRSLMNGMHNLCCEQAFSSALTALGLDVAELREQEPDAALGNGGLGRLAACLLDSMATVGIAGYGYGIRYEYGMFFQRIEDGRQVESPDNWLRYGNPWEFPRPEVLYQVKFHGRVVNYVDEHGRAHFQWVDTDDVMAMAYDYPVPGYDTGTVNNMRLWAAKSTHDFDLQYFNEGNYIRAVEHKNESENLSKVLYPDDTTRMGRELRLKQQYFFVCASLQDILYRFAKSGDPIDGLPDKVAIQLNDTHPSIGIAELMRILVDQHQLDWERAWDITRRTYAYTNHTLMPEALEAWPVALLERVLPRHLQIIYEINHRFLKDVIHHYPDDPAVWQRMSLIDEADGRRVRMAHLAIVGSHKVNGVAAIHTRLMKETIFSDFHRLWPDRIVNITNGVTPRRWLNQANPALAALISSRIGKGWVKDLGQLRQLEALAEDTGFRAAFAQVKRDNKVRLAGLIASSLDLRVDPDSLYDVQIKRIHEYKRQLLNVLHVITLYTRLRAGADVVPRTVIFGGKAAPAYAMAKLIIRLINDVADIVNNDPLVRDRLKVVFLPNYDVSRAELIIPAADLSEQISTAGTEASGTGNMKLAMNGALTIGTLDGANVEIRDEVGADNIFIFGMTADIVAQRRAEGYDPWGHYNSNAELRQVMDMIRDGYFSPDERSRYQAVFEALTVHGDRYMLLADYADYIACQERAARLYRSPFEWMSKAILNVAGMGRFSTDRTICEYAATIWNVTPSPRPVRAA